MLYRNNCLNSLVEKCLIVKKEKKYNYIRKAAESRYQGDLIVLEYFLLAIIQGIPPGKCYFQGDPNECIFSAVRRELLGNEF